MGGEGGMAMFNDIVIFQGGKWLYSQFSGGEWLGGKTTIGHRHELFLNLNTCNYNKLFLDHLAGVQDNFQTDEGI